MQYSKIQGYKYFIQLGEIIRRDIKKPVKIQSGNITEYLNKFNKINPDLIIKAIDIEPKKVIDENNNYKWYKLVVIRTKDVGVTEYIKSDERSLYLRSVSEPFTVCKIVRIADSISAIDFKCKPVNYIVKQIPGFRIFLVQAGFFHPPKTYISPEIIDKQMQLMADWYLKNKTSNKRERNNYEIK